MVIPTTDTTFDVLQYHIHAGSDHSLDNMHFGADMHIVHKNRNGDDLAVLGMFLEPSNDENTGLFDVLIAGLEDVAQTTTKACQSNQTGGTTTQGIRTRRARYLQDVYNPYTKLPANSTMYYYSGSLTTPPCSEIVSWNVVDTPISLSIIEYKSIVDLILSFTDPATCLPASVHSPSGYTSRPVQPLNGRTITHFCPKGTESRFDTLVSLPTTEGKDSNTTSAGYAPIMTMAFALTIIATTML
jgi:carbonic anhydrase